MKHKPQTPDAQPWDLPPNPESKRKDKGKMKEKGKKMNVNEEEDLLSDDESVDASSLLSNQDTVTDAARNRVQELLARWTAPEPDPSTPRGGEGDDVNLREAARPDASSVAGRDMAGTIHPSREDHNEEYKGVPAPTVSQALPEQPTPEQPLPEQPLPEQAPPEQAPSKS